MRKFNEWMDEYGVSHKNPINQTIHKICVPLIMLTVVGLLWCLPRPQLFTFLPYFNWATLFIAGCLCFYLILNFKMFLGMLVQTIIMCFLCQRMEKDRILLPFSIIVFILAWIAQFWGHKVEGKRPSFLQDLVFLLIGPLWVTRFFYQKIGLKV
jgi:uncharacterized membrane protein YGL010W